MDWRLVKMPVISMIALVMLVVTTMLRVIHTRMAGLVWVIPVEMPEVAPIRHHVNIRSERLTLLLAASPMHPMEPRTGCRLPVATSTSMCYEPIVLLKELTCVV
jgi:hypothetical protein